MTNSIQPSGDGFVDLQINGCFGVDFNDDKLSEEGLVRACERLREEGTAGILATVITADVAAMCRRLRRLCEIRTRQAAVRDLIWGFHIEGPFISARPGFVGAHPAEFVRPVNADLMERLLEAGEGLTRVVTLAPEQDAELRVTKRLAQQGIVVAAGHCDPTRDQLAAAIDAGLSLFTHLGNGCPRELERHDNIIQRALSLSDRLWCSVIVDGVHVPYFVLQNWLRCLGYDRAIVVSDAIAAAGMGAGTYSLAGTEVEVAASGATRLAGRLGYLAGSTTTLAQAARNLQTGVGLDAAAIQKLTSANPRQLLGR